MCIRDSIKPLTRLRIDLSHGRLDQIPMARASSVYGAIRTFRPELLDDVLDDEPFGPVDDPAILLRRVLGVIWAALGGCEMHARQRREQLDADIASGLTGEAAAELAVMLLEMDLRFVRRSGGSAL